MTVETYLLGALAAAFFLNGSSIQIGRHNLNADWPFVAAVLLWPATALGFVLLLAAIGVSWLFDREGR